MIPALSAITTLFLAQAGNSSDQLEENLDRFDSSKWEKADWPNGNPFNNTWRPDKVLFNKGVMTLVLDNDGCPALCKGKPYVSGELRTTRNYGYGYLESRIKAAKAPGTTTTLFFYSGEWGKPSHNEIDVEIFGKDPTKMQINYYAYSKQGHEKVIDLGFDASQGFHTYGIKWAKNSIEWYVDGKMVHRVIGTPATLPSKPSKIMLNLWPGIGVDGWLGKFRYASPVKAEYDWVKFTPLNKLPASGLPPAPASTPIVTPPIRPGAISSRTLPTGIPDPTIGRRTVMELKPKLKRELVALHLDVEQMEETLAALSSAVKDSYEHIIQVGEIDKKNHFKLQAYFMDPHEYWNNTIILLSAYVQKITESAADDKDERLQKALAMVEIFEAGVNAQTNNAPLSYNFALLALTKAEIYSQSENKDAMFYENGIELTIAAVKRVMDIELEHDYPSKADYYSVAKGILVLGNLYSRLANITQLPEHYEKTEYLFNRLLAMDEEKNGEMGIGLEVDLPELHIKAAYEDIHDALNFNLGENYLTPEDKEQALTGIFHQLKGMTQIASASFFAARPGLKSIDAIFEQLTNSISGMLELKGAMEAASLPEKKNEFFYAQAQLVQGELLMLLADRLNYYYLGGSGTDMVFLPDSLKAALGEARKAFGADPRFQALDDEFPLLEANQLINIAKEYYFKGLPKKYKYLFAQSIVKQLEIAIRNAEFVQDDKMFGKIADATKLLAFCDKYRDIIEDVAKDKLIPEYLKIEFDYLELIARVTGTAEKVNGNYKIIFDDQRNPHFVNKLFPLRGLSLIKQIEEKIPYLGGSSRAYFDINIALKEAAIMIQISQHSDRDVRDSNEVKERIRQKTGRKMSTAQYALWILKNVEKRIAPAIPPYLEYNTNKTLRELINKGAFGDERVKKNLAALGEFVGGNELKALHAQIAARNKAGAILALDALLAKLKSLSAPGEAFVSTHSEVNAWDMHTVYAELYHLMAIVCGIQRYGIQFYQYGQSAYIESARSSSNYDQESRPSFIYDTTRSRADKSIPRNIKNNNRI